MYDRVTDLLGGYADFGHVEPNGELWATPHDHVHEATSPAGSWYDDGFVYDLGVVYGDGPAFGPVGAAAGAWEDKTAFVPPPRAPVDAASPVRSGHPVGPPVSRHRRRSAFPRPAWPQLISSVFGVLTAVTVIAACVLGWVFSYGPLQELAFSRVPRGLSQLWPVVVYGPWLAGCLSVLRAVQHGRQPFHSWAVVVLFSSLAAGLCVADVSWTLSAVVVAGLPPLTGVISLHQLVRQLNAARGAREPLDRQAGRRARR
ncbi:DUF2637 domain-containing protein [Streptomyces sp. SP17BM10]|uniref:DUF2637 domain-containing protein n=1 Tax=Streptomyces sp. SP17BM10 TaxID=3002530 RepID=UPI002E777B22|nr:DUF2637 domain-containing protein [Streptomyces sp. SP17BM10]MEE1785759.1 DUF2637 domain-containing protein [Streptomyces sp. SP17BM10]